MRKINQILGNRFLAPAAALAAVLVASQAAAQITQQLPRDAVQPRVPLPQVEPPRLDLPPYFGTGTDAAKSWLTPMLFARTQAGDPPEPIDPALVERFDNLPFIPIEPDDDDAPVLPPIGGPFPPVPGAGPWVGPRPGAGSRPPYEGPGPRTQSITVINVNRFDAVTVWTKCFTRDGVNIPTLSREDTVRPLAMLNYAPVIYLGDRGPGGGVAPFWCVIAASAPVTAHAQTQNYDYVDFFAAAR